MLNLTVKCKYKTNLQKQHWLGHYALLQKFLGSLQKLYLHHMLLQVLLCKEKGRMKGI